MAIVNQTKRRKVVNALAYIEDNIHQANNSLLIEERDAPEYDTGFKSGRDQAAKLNLRDIVKMLRWLADDLGVGTLPKAFTDQQIDDLNRDIRVFEDHIEEEV